MEANTLPLVSIIMPTYNSIKYIEASVESIIAQTYNNWELLITDDNSQDNTFDIIKSYQERDNRIKGYKLNNNSGAGIARNNSIRAATGDFIAFCDSDDLWTPDKLEKQVAFMINNTVDLSYANYYIINEKNIIIGERNLPSKIDYKKMLINNYIGCLTAVYNARKLGKIYMQDLRNRQDWLLWLEILKKTEYAFNIEDKIAYYRERSDSISANKVKMMKINWKIYRKYEGLSFFTSIYYLLQYILMYFKKKKA